MAELQPTKFKPLENRKPFQPLSQKTQTTSTPAQVTPQVTPIAPETIQSKPEQIEVPPAMTTMKVVKEVAKLPVTIGVEFLKSLPRSARTVEKLGTTFGSFLERKVSEGAQALGLQDEYKNYWKQKGAQYGINSAQSAERLQNALQENTITKFLTKDETDASPYKSKKEMALDSIELALTVGSALPIAAAVKPSLYTAETVARPAITTLLRGAATQAEKQAFTIGAKRFALNSSIDTLLGGTYGGVQSLRDGTSVKNGIMGGAAFSFLFPIGFGTLIKGATTTTKALAGGLKKGLETIEQKTAPIISKEVGLDAIANGDKANLTFGSRMKNTVHNVSRDLLDAPSAIKQKFVDSFAPVSTLEKQIETQLGRKLDTEESTYIRARLGTGRIAGIAEGLNYDYQKIINPEIDDDVNKYLVAQDFLYRSGKGQSIDSRTNVGEVMKYLDDVKTNPKYQEIVTSAHEKKLFFDRLLDEKVQAGVYTKEFANDLKSRQWYTPHIVSDFFDSEAANNGIGAGFSSSKGTIKKSEGSLREIEDVNTAASELFKRHAIEIGNKEVLDTVFDNHALLGEKSPFKILKEGEQPKAIDLEKQGLVKLSRIKDGVREDILVPKDYGEALRMSDALGTSNKLWKAVTWLSGAPILRPLVTTFSLPFTIKNAMRDIQTQGTLTKEGFNPMSWVKALKVTSKGVGALEDDAYQQAKKIGVFVGSVYDDAKPPSKVLRGVNIPTEKNNPFGRVLSKVTSPFQTIKELGQSIEEATRLSSFQNALRGGASPLEAAFIARNATVDFQRMGTWMKYINQIIPFTNARLQGTINQFNAAAKDPYRFARKQLYFSVFPTVMLYNNNARYLSYYSIPDQIKNDNWVIMTGETKGVDAQGNNTVVPHYVTIPKGETVRALSSSLERFFDWERGQDVKGGYDLAVDILKSQSPVSGADFLPPTFSTLVEGKANYDFFREKEIVPAFMKERSPEYQKYESTPQAYQKIGNMLGISPLKVEFALGNIFGSYPSDITKTSDLLLNGFADDGYKQIPGDKFEHWTQIPVLGSFLRTDNYRESPKKEEAVQRAAQRKADLTAEVDSQLAPYIRNSDIESVRMYFQKNLDIFETPQELENAINRTMKKLIERKIPKNDYSGIDGEALYYLNYEDFSGGKKDLQTIAQEAFEKGATPAQVEKMLIFFLK